MDVAVLPFSDPARPARSGSFAVDENRRVVLRASPALGRALEAATRDPREDLAPLSVDDPALGLALLASLARGVAADLLECDFAAGAFEVRAFLGGKRVRITLPPGNFDPDAAWDFLLTVNEAKLESPRA